MLLFCSFWLVPVLPTQGSLHGCLLVAPQQQRREKELRKQQEREQRRHYEEQMRREEERRRAEHEQVPRQPRRRQPCADGSTSRVWAVGRLLLGLLRFKQVFTLSQATILTYSRSQTHNLGKAHSFNLVSSPGRSPPRHLDLVIFPTLGIYSESSTEV